MWKLTLGYSITGIAPPPSQAIRLSFCNLQSIVHTNLEEASSARYTTYTINVIIISSTTSRKALLGFKPSARNRCWLALKKAHLSFSLKTFETPKDWKGPKLCQPLFAIAWTPLSNHTKALV
jgi:hypothetical protein